MRHQAVLAFFALSFQLWSEPRQDVVRIASTLLETKEDWGPNSGPLVDKILASVGLAPGHPWCAAFNYYVFREAGLSDRVPRTGWSPDWVSGERKPTDKAEPADIFGIYFSKLRRVAHTGIIEEPKSKYCITIEGNTNDGGSRDGDGVYRRRRSNQTLIVKDWIEGKAYAPGNKKGH
jgi:hypothetical protein